MRNQIYLCTLGLISLYAVSRISGATSNDGGAKKATTKAKKLPNDPLYITDMDLENLYDQWEEADEEKLPQDELPPHKRKHVHHQATSGGGLSEELLKNPDKLMMASKKGKTVMAFVTIDNAPTKEETEQLTQRWQVGLTNNHMKCERFVIADDRAIFVFEDGALAFEAKSFFIDQPELKEYSIDNRVWHGRASLARNEECAWDSNESGKTKSNNCKKANK